MSLVSVIMPSYNSESYIAESIISVINQTYGKWELIIIDDCSTDSTTSIVNSFSDKRIKLIKNTKNLGAAKSRNIGIKAASGRFIAFLDSDDLWEKEKLEEQISFMQKRKISFCYSAYRKINEKNKEICIINVPETLYRDQLLKTCYIGCLTAIYDTHMLGKIYMHTDTKREDYATWLSIIKLEKKLYGIPKVLASYRIHGQQSSKNKINMALENWKIYRKKENLPLLLSIYYFSNYAIRGIIRSKKQYVNIINLLHKAKTHAK